MSNSPLSATDNPSASSDEESGADALAPAASVEDKVPAESSEAAEHHSAEASKKRDKAVTEEQLSACGEAAADFVEGLLDIYDAEGDLDIEIGEDRVTVLVSSELPDQKLNALADPEVIRALRNLTLLSVKQKLGMSFRLTLVIGDSEQRREHDMRELVLRAIDQIEGGAEAVAMPPMSSYDRKLVHRLAAELGYLTESTGEGSQRHTVISRSSRSEAS